MTATYDTEYAIELWDYSRKYLTVEDAIRVISGNSIDAEGEGIEALEDYFMPTVGTVPRISEHQLEEMPDMLANKVWEAELEALENVTTMVNPDKKDVFKLINWLEVGEYVLGIEIENRIVEAIHALPECESKVDMLEKHDEISGEEWYQRASELEVNA